MLFYSFLESFCESQVSLEAGCSARSTRREVSFVLGWLIHYQMYLEYNFRTFNGRRPAPLKMNHLAALNQCDWRVILTVQGDPRPPSPAGYLSLPDWLCHHHLGYYMWFSLWCITVPQTCFMAVTVRVRVVACIQY